MAGFTTTNDGSWEFSFGDDLNPKPKLRDTFAVEETYLASADRWANYSDQVLYECECLIREFFEIKSNDEGWLTKPRLRKYTNKKMFRVLFGRDYDYKTDSKYNMRIARLMAYYSSKITRQGEIDGEKCKRVYTLSPARYKRNPPYSLRLRLEWLGEKGEIPTWENMELAKDDLKPGHARLPKTEANMRKRRERARALYNERYNKKS